MIPTCKACGNPRNGYWDDPPGERLVPPPCPVDEVNEHGYCSMDCWREHDYVGYSQYWDSDPKMRLNRLLGELNPHEKEID